MIPADISYDNDLLHSRLRDMLVEYQRWKRGMMKLAALPVEAVANQPKVI
jgi:hypothetical protein